MDIPTVLLVSIRALTTSVPDSAGVPKDDTKNTLVAEYNDKDSVQKLFDENKDRSQQ